MSRPTEAEIDDFADRFMKEVEAAEAANPVRLVKVQITEYVRETFEVEIELEEGEELSEDHVEAARVNHEGDRAIEVTDFDWQEA